MNVDFTIEELNLMHLALITRERIIREQWIPNTSDIDAANRLMDEANRMITLQRKVCAAQLSKETGFEISPYVESAA